MTGTSEFPLPASSGIEWHQASAETNDGLPSNLKRSEITAIMGAPPAMGLQGWLHENLRINVGLGAQERAQREEQVEDLKRDRIRDLEVVARIGREMVRTNGYAGFLNVMSEKGGCGKTTLVCLLAYELEVIRRERIVVTDINPDKGSLSSRMGVSPKYSLKDMIEAYDDIVRGDRRVSDFLSPVGSTGINVLSGDMNPDYRQETSEMDVIKTFQLLAPVASMVLLDNGTGITHSALSGSLQVSHGMALIMENTLDAEDFIQDTLTFLQKNRHDDLRRRLVLVINDKAAITPERSRQMIDDLMLKFNHQVRGIVVIPFDRSIAEGGPIDFKQVGGETRKAIRHLAALLMDDMIR